MGKRVAELDGRDLDYSVARVEGWMTRGTGFPLDDPAEWVMPNGLKGAEAPPAFSTSWAHGGPIIDREGIAVMPYPGPCWVATIGEFGEIGFDTRERDLKYGTTPLIAAMRCFVASKFGETVG